MDVKQVGSNKILWHLDRVKEFLRTGYIVPITVVLDTAEYIIASGISYENGFVVQRSDENQD